MKLVITALMLALSLTAVARRPAVEDFVGVESETPDVTPTGAETLYNFSQEVQDFQTDGPRVVVRHPRAVSEMPLAAVSSATPLWFGAAFVLCLPMITWLVMARHLKQREARAAAATASNVTDLAARRAEKQAQDSSSDEIKKAG